MIEAENKPRRSAHHVGGAWGRTERAVAGLVMAWVVVVPWLLGGRYWWAQAAGAVVGAITLMVAVLPAQNRKALARFPIFWLGLVFLGYLICQALNPWIAAIPVQPGPARWDTWLKAAPAPVVGIWNLNFLTYKAWLPAGVRADYFDNNTWRSVVYWGGPWMLVCAWWIAVRRRRAALALWTVVFLNGLAISGVTIGYAFKPTHEILWFYVEPGLEYGPNSNWHHVKTAYVGAFTYPNAASAYLYLSMAAGLGLVLRARQQARDLGRDSGFSWVIFVGCIFIMAGILLSTSRAGLLFGVALLGAGGLMIAWDGLREAGWSPGRLIPAAVIGAGLLAALGAFFMTAKPKSVDRLRASFLTDQTRMDLWYATTAMIKDRPWVGFGGGSYPYISPYYFSHLGLFTDTQAYTGLAYRANYAHSDWLQYPMEYGGLGAGVLLLMLLYWAGKAWALRRQIGLKGGIVLVGLVLVATHTAADFIFSNAAVVTLFAMLLAATLRMAVTQRSLERGEAA